jgi:hypothetical protein
MSLPSYHDFPQHLQMLRQLGRGLDCESFILMETLCLGAYVAPVPLIYPAVILAAKIKIVSLYDSKKID